MSSSVLTAFLTALAPALPSTISSALGSTSQNTAQVQSLIMQLESVADQPVLAAQFAHDLSVSAIGMPFVQAAAVQVWQATQNPATYNALLVMSKCQMMLSNLTQQNSSLFSGLAGLLPTGTTISTPATTTTLA